MQGVKNKPWSFTCTGDDPLAKTRDNLPVHDDLQSWYSKALVKRTL